MNKRIAISMIAGLTSFWLAQATAQNKFNPPPVSAPPPIIKISPVQPNLPPPKLPPAPPADQPAPDMSIPSLPMPQIDAPSKPSGQMHLLPPPVSPPPQAGGTAIAPPVSPGVLPTDPTGGLLKDRTQPIDGAPHSAAAAGELDKDLGLDAAMGADPRRSVQEENPHRKRAVTEEDFRDLAGPLPSVGRAKASSTGKETKSAPASVAKIVSDRVLKSGNHIAGGWREYAADGLWRRVVFTLEDHTATVVFSDGMPGGLLPAVTHFMRYRSVAKGSPALYHETRIFTGAPPVILDKAKLSSLIPSDVETRILELARTLDGVDFGLLQQLMDDKRGFAEVGSAFDAARGAHDAGGFFADWPAGGFRPGGSSRPRDADWSDPRSAAGGRCPGCASDDPQTTDEDGNTVVFHAGGRETTYIDVHGDGSLIINTTKDASGNTTGGGGYSRDPNGDINTWSYSVNRETNTTHYKSTLVVPGDSAYTAQGNRRTNPGIMPSETGGSGGNLDTRLAKAVPWLFDLYYAQWKHESDLVQSGGRISQPGEQPTLIFSEVPRVGAQAVVNCGASDSIPSARPAGVAVNPRGGFRSISQPGRGVGPDTPAETGVPPPIPEPAPQ